MTRTKLGWCSALAVTMFMCAIPQARASGNIDLFLGQKNLDKDFGSGRNIEDQDAIGLFFDWGQKSWPVHIALDLLVGSKDNNGDNFDVDLDGSTAEILVGVRWYPAKASDTHWMPHLGGGLGLISGKVKADDSAASDDLRFDDSKLGLWGDAGVQYRFGEHFKVGGRVKYSRAKVDNPGGNVKEIEAGGFSYGIDGGWTW